MEWLCDSNIGERDLSFAPLVAWLKRDGTVVIQNTAVKQANGFLGETYPSLRTAAESRGFIARYMGKTNGKR